MGAREKNRFWQPCRIYFRRMRLAVWLVLLGVVGCLVYLNQVGLPDFAKKRVVERLRAHGLDVQAGRVRLSFYRGLLAENVRFGQTSEPLGPNFTASQLELQLNPKALLRLRAQIDGVTLLRGRLAWPAATAGNTNRELAIEKIHTDLRFLPGDMWALDNLRAEFAGAQFSLVGTVTNASAVREWPFWRSTGPVPPGLVQNRLVQLADTLERVRFKGTPELSLFLHGDAADPQSFNVRLSIVAPDADTPWGDFTRSKFHAKLSPAGSNQVSLLSFTLDSARAHTRWANTTNLHLEVQSVARETQTNFSNAKVSFHAASAATPWASGDQLSLEMGLTARSDQLSIVDGELSLAAERLHSKWANGADAKLSVRWAHSVTNPIPISGEGTLTCANAESRWAQGRGIEFHAKFETPTGENAPVELGAESLWWTNLQPYALEWALRCASVQSTGMVTQPFVAEGNWTSPKLLVTNLHAQFPHGAIDGSVALNVLTRETQLQLKSDADPLQLLPLLPNAAKKWLSQFTWAAPPRVSGGLSATLPAWTNREPDWRQEFLPSLAIRAGFVASTNGSYRGVQVAGARSDILYSNMCWVLPNLEVFRPDGVVKAEHIADERGRDFYWHINGAVSPNALRPALETNVTRVLDLFSLTAPVAVNLTIRGRSQMPERTWVKGHVALTNFTFRGESFTGVETMLEFTNKQLFCYGPSGSRGTQHLSADSLVADFNKQLIYLTNGFTTADPMPIARAIGPNVGRVLEPYKFLLPPTVQVNGIIPMRGEEDADLHFHVEGGPFHWNKFKIRHIAGEVHWVGMSLKLNNLQADFYGGAAGGYAQFAFTHKAPTTFHFAVSTTNSLLQPLMTDYFGRTNLLEGFLTADLVVTKASDDNWNSAEGYGNLALHDGLVWDIPLFGVFSPVLNGISPGLGNSRASEGTCSFTMTNGILHTKDLSIRSPAFRMLYRGDLSLRGEVKARVEAELFRDVWLVGPLVSSVFWPVTKMFEYRVSGMLDKPQMDPVYIIPKVVLFPLQPFRALKGLLPAENKQNNTNAPPEPEKAPGQPDRQ